MHQIFTIARFELAKKKVAAKPGAIIGLLVVLLLFVGAFFLLSHSGYRPVHQYYSIPSTGGPLDSYVVASQNIRLSDDAPVSVLLRADSSYILSAEQRFVGMATATALSEMLKQQNRELILTSGIEPSFLVLLNITTRTREEILQPIQPIQPISANSANATPTPEVNRLGYRVTRNNSVDILVSKKLLDVDNELNNFEQNQFEQLPSAATPSSEGSVLATQQVTRPVITSGEQIDVDELRAQDEFSNAETVLGEAEIADGLQHPGDINTLQGVKDLFIIIELMLVFNFFAALLGNSFFEEKLNYRSSILFSMPIRRRYVILGKLLPYLFFAIFFACTLLFLQYPFVLKNPVTYLLLLVLAFIYFSLSFLNGLLARSNKEYSFLNVFTTSILSLYLLIPAFVANYSTLGYASLLTPLLFLAQQQVVSVSLLIFLSVIYAALAFVVFFLGSALWNFEHLYKFESPLKKLQFILRTNTKTLWQFFIYGICCVPFLWLAQIVMIASFLIIPLDNKLFLFLFGAAFCEEYVRNLVIRAHVAYKRTSPVNVELPLTRLKRSIAIGLGFGLAEKIILVIAIAPYLEGYQYIITAGIIVPIILHSMFTYLFSYLVETRDFFARHPTLLCALIGLVHATFNFVVITYVGVTLI